MTNTRTADQEYVLKIIDGPQAKQNSARLASVNYFPLALAPALRELLAEGVLELVEITKPHKVDPTKTMTYTYVRRTTT